MRSYFILTMCGLFLIYYFVQSQWLKYVVVSFVLMAFAGSIKKADPLPKWLGSLMLGLGIILEYKKGTGVEGISEGILRTLPLLTLVILAPLHSLPLKIGGYFEAIHSLLHQLKHQPQKLFAGITSVLFLLSPILNLGSIRILDELLKDLKLSSEMLAKGYLIGFSTALLWSPYFASVSLVLYFLNIPISEYILYGMGLSIVTLLIGNLLFAIQSHRHRMVEESVIEKPLNTIQRKQLQRLGSFILILISMTLLIEYITHWSMLVIVSLLSVFFPLLWAMVSKKWNPFLRQLAHFRDVSVPMMNNEIILFTSAGLLGSAMQGTSFGYGMQWILSSLANHSFLLFAMMVIMTVVVLSFFGVHLIVIVSTLASQMNAQELGTSNYALAMLLLLAWSVSAVLSPVSALNIMVSRLSGISEFGVGLRANGLHLSIVTLIGLLIIAMVH